LFERLFQALERSLERDPARLDEIHADAQMWRLRKPVSDLISLVQGAANRREETSRERRRLRQTQLDFKALRERTTRLWAEHR
jgi:hypothetical protein